MRTPKTKIGDVFSVKIDDRNKKYFQLIAFDLMQLNSDVIRAFMKKYPLMVDPELSEIVGGDVEFYAHCGTKLGLNMGLWERIGNTVEIGNVNNVLFRDTNDYGSKVDEEAIKISKEWYVWRINDNNFKRVGKLEGENRKAEIGIVVSPQDVIDRISTGKYNFLYPGYE